LARDEHGWAVPIATCQGFKVDCEHRDGVERSCASGEGQGGETLLPSDISDAR
jgi:hypothetical protein